MEKQHVNNGQEQLKQVRPAPPSLLYKIVVTVIGSILVVVWIYVSKNVLYEDLKQSMFSKNPLKTLDDSMDLVADIGLFSAIYLVTLTFTVMSLRVVNHSINPATMPRLQPAQRINELIRSFTQSLIVFCCLFVYYLQNTKSTFFDDSGAAKIQSGFILPIWLLTGYAGIWIGNLLQMIVKKDIGMKFIGQIVVVWAFAVLLAQINGISLVGLI